MKQKTIEDIALFVSKAQSEKLDSYEIYNRWVSESKVILKNPREVQWTLGFISDLRKIPVSIINESLE